MVFTRGQNTTSPTEVKHKIVVTDGDDNDEGQSAEPVIERNSSRNTNRSTDDKQGGSVVHSENAAREENANQGTPNSSTHSAKSQVFCQIASKRKCGLKF